MEQQATIHDSIIAYAKDLRLPSIWKNYTEATAVARDKNWSVEQFLLYLLEIESNARVEN